MSRPTYPAVFMDEAAGTWKCEMRDKVTGRTWGAGYGETRQEAIYNARHDQPQESVIKKAVGWVTRHPFIGGAAVGVYLAARYGARHERRPRRPSIEDHILGSYPVAAVVVGTVTWAVAQAIKFISKPFRN